VLRTANLCGTYLCSIFVGVHRIGQLGLSEARRQLELANYNDCEATTPVV